jgi:aromatic-L-amino-acid/L-tryptophan decarboxylase
MPEPHSYHMTPEDFRRYGRDVVDWVADYLEHLDSYPVLAQVAPGEVRAALPEHPPRRPEPFAEMLADLGRVVVPGLTHWQSPNFFAYYPANSSAPSVLGDLVSSGLGVQGMSWATSPAATEVETHVLDWLAELLGLPETFRSSGSGGGAIEDSASSSSLVALIAARERATAGRANADGVAACGQLVAYASREAHSSIEKAARIAGIGSTNLRLVDVDGELAMRLDHLERLVADDVAAGRLPFFVTATVGTTGTSAIDPVRAIAEVCRRHGIWLHVDAAHAGSAAICPELRWINDGVEHADSYVVDAHKWLFTNFDCSMLYVADRGAVETALSITPEYLRIAGPSTDVIDYRNWMIALGRRFRALKLWFVLRWYGTEGLRYHVGRHVALAQEFAEWVDADPSFERVTPTPLNLVCFRHVDDDAFGEELLATLNRSGAVYLTHTRVDGRYVLRMSISGTYTERQHVERAWALIRETAADIARRRR